MGSGLALPLYLLARLTVSFDCFPWRNTVGLDVALEVARSYLKRRGASPSTVMEYEALHSLDIQSPSPDIRIAQKQALITCHAIIKAAGIR